MTDSIQKTKKLGELRPGDRGLIYKVAAPEDATTKKFMDIGILEGSTFELVHEAPFGGDPIVVRVRGALIAIRRLDAGYVEVTEVVSGAK